MYESLLADCNRADLICAFALTYESPPFLLPRPRYFIRHHNAAASFPEIPRFIYRLREVFKTWTDDLLLSPPTFVDSLSHISAEDRAFILSQLSNQLEALCSTADRETGRVKLPTGTTIERSNSYLGEGQIAMLYRQFEGPGGRHNNDHATIQQIQIAPTHQELMSDEVSVKSLNDVCQISHV